MDLKNDLKDPYISVIITAHNRKQFLIDAIKSVLNQTLDRSFYEIIVVKNFEDEKIDEIIKKNDIISLRTGDKTLVGEDYLLAIEKSKGEVLSFLDDDDLFFPEKLEKIYDIFTSDEKIVFYHNYQIYQTLDGRKTKTIFKSFKGFFSSNDLIKNLKRIIHMDYYGPLFFNMSSICIKKYNYIENLNILKLINTHPDDFFFFFAINGENKLFFDDTPLTVYRVHESASNINSEDIKSKGEVNLMRGKLFDQYSKVTKILIDNIENKELIRFLNCRYVSECLQKYIYLKRAKGVKPENKILIRRFYCFNYFQGNIFKRFYKLIKDVFKYL